MAGLILALICAAAADQPVPGHTVSSVVSERGPAINQGPRQIQYKGSAGSCPRVLHVSFRCVRVLSVVGPKPYAVGQPTRPTQPFILLG